MSKVRIELNRSGVGELLKSPEMQEILSQHAHKIAGSSGREVKEYVAQTRAVAIVRGDDGNNGLLKGLGNK